MKIDSSETICSIFVDLSKAFDTVNHQIKYLGIYIDKNLNWVTHIEHINSKISKKNGIPF